MKDIIIPLEQLLITISLQLHQKLQHEDLYNTQDQGSGTVFPKT